MGAREVRVEALGAPPQGRVEQPQHHADDERGDGSHDARREVREGVGDPCARGDLDGADPIDALDKAILNDLIEAYATHEPSTCNSAASVSATSFSFDWPGTNSQSNWFAPLVSFEQGLFQAILSHNDSTGNRSWSIRIGSGGNIYSHFVPNMHGETIPPQSTESPWVDEVIQSVAVNLQLNMNLSLPQYCPGPNTH